MWVGRMTDSSSAWPASETLGQLVREAQRDGPDALNRLLATLRPALLRFFERRFPSDMTEDLAQLALMRIAKALRRIDPERADSYTITVARNLLRSAYRQRARDVRRYSPVGAELAATIPASDSQAEYEELVLAVHRTVLTKLPRPLQDIMSRVLDDETPSQIADELHVSPVTVRTRLMRARWILRRELVAFTSCCRSRVGPKADGDQGPAGRVGSP
jgi:RNA polymerase sigma factor (sigma-70 family)